MLSNDYIQKVQLMTIVQTMRVLINNSTTPDELEQLILKNELPFARVNIDTNTVMFVMVKTIKFYWYEPDKYKIEIEYSETIRLHVKDETYFLR